MIKVISINPYDTVAGLIKEDCNVKGQYGDYIVRLKLDGRDITVYLEWNGMTRLWEWAYDWWEGEEGIWLLDFCPIDEVELPDVEFDNGKLKIITKKEGQ